VDRYAMSITSTLIDGADIRFREAADVLRPYVGCFWVITAQRGATIRVVPDGSTAISIRIENGRCSGWLLRGPLVEPDERCYAAPATLVGVRLRPGVAVLVSGIAADRTLGRRIELAGIAPSAGAEHDASWTPAQYIDTLERFLIDRIGNARVPDIVSRAIQEIEREHGSLRVSALAERCGVSPRHLNRLMRGWVGYGPKCFARIVRFQTTLHQIEHSPAQSGATLASDTGYFDQAHLTLDVTRLAGATPRHLASHSVSDFSKTRCDDLP
jgi:AraC-like DNA-binding protein